MKFELEVVKFNVNDVVTASTTQGGGTTPGGTGQVCLVPQVVPNTPRT